MERARSMAPSRTSIDGGCKRHASISFRRVSARSARARTRSFCSRSRKHLRATSTACRARSLEKEEVGRPAENIPLVRLSMLYQPTRRSIHPHDSSGRGCDSSAKSRGRTRPYRFPKSDRLRLRPGVNAVALGGPEAESFVEHGDLGEPLVDELFRESARLGMGAGAIADQPSVFRKLVEIRLGLVKGHADGTYDVL